MTVPTETCLQIIRRVQGRECTARSIVDAYLARSEQYQDKYRGFIQLTPDLARKQAERVDAIIGMGRKLPLAGVPFAVKDLIDVRGTATTAGCQVFKNRLADQDATIIKKLVAVGAVFMGKLNMHECAFGHSGDNSSLGRCLNPWSDSHSPGGSSSGSAVAIALDLCPIAIGSDTGGSIRFPAATCGVLGIKPTYGRISRAGALPLAWSLDHLGPMTRTAEDCALILRVLAGNDPADPSSSKQPAVDYSEEISKPLTGVRLGVPTNWFFDDLDADVASSITKVIDQLIEQGATRVDCEIPFLSEMRGAHRTILFAESANYHRPYLESQPEKYSPGVRHLLQTGLFISATDYLQAQRVRRYAREQWVKCFSQFDVLVTPSFNRPMAPIESASSGDSRIDGMGGRAILDTLWPFNLSGYPALTTPCGFTTRGLPIGVQFAARPFDEAAILRTAHQFQLITDWHLKRPS